MNAAELSQVFDAFEEQEAAALVASAASGFFPGAKASTCPLPQPELDAPRGFYDHRKCCAPKQRRSHLHTHLNGTASETPRPCWQLSKWVNYERSTTREVEEWVC